MRVLFVLLLLSLPRLALAGDPAPGPRLEPKGPAAKAPVFVTMTVLNVVQLDDSWAVLLTRPEEDLYLPIYIGNAEGLAIRMRLDHKVAPRPMTHDLLESTIEALGAKVTKIEIDDLRHDVFLGRLHLQQGARPVELDARPSDAIAVALGTGAPIYVSRRVLDRAGLTKKDLQQRRGRPPEEPQKPESL